MKNVVNSMLDDEAYKLLKLPTIEFTYGEIEFFDKKTIDDAQAGFRYNALTGEKIEEWTGDEYVIVGYDATAGCGPDPYIVKTSDSKLPVYWLMADGGDWSNPDLICDSLDNFNKIISMLASYEEYFSGELTPDLKEEILDKISEIENSSSVNEYWNELLDRAMPLDY